MKKIPNIPFLSHDRTFMMMADSSSDLVIIVDAKRVILYVNRTTCQKTGYTQKELIGKKNTVLYGKDNSSRYTARMSKALRESGRWRGNLEVKKKEGTMFGADTSVFQFCDKSGKPSGALYVGCDLSGQRLLEQHALESQSELYQALESTEDAFCLTDLRGKILMCNDAHARILGYSKGEIIGTEIPYPWVDPSDAGKMKLAMQIVRKEHALKHYHIVWRKKDRSCVTVSLSMAERADGKKTKGYIVTIRDVSGLQYVEELRRSNERISRLLLDIKRKAQRLQTLEEINSLVLKNADVPRIFTSITSGIKKLVEHDLAGIYVYDSQGESFLPHTLSKQTPFSRKLGKFPLPLGEGIIGSAAITGKMVLANNAQNDPRSKYPEHMKPQREHFIAVPLKGRGPLFGVLVVARHRDPEFIEEEAILVKSFAEAATVALENARLFQQLHNTPKSISPAARASMSSKKISRNPAKHAVGEQTLEKPL